MAESVIGAVEDRMDSTSVVVESRIFWIIEDDMAVAKLKILELLLSN